MSAISNTILKLVLTRPCLIEVPPLSSTRSGKNAGASATSGPSHLRFNCPLVMHLIILPQRQPGEVPEGLLVSALYFKDAVCPAEFAFAFVCP